MWGINKVVLVGHLGKDPESRRLGDNISVVSFPLATSEQVNIADNRVEETEWHNIIMWRSLAEAAPSRTEPETWRWHFRSSR